MSYNNDSLFVFAWVASDSVSRASRANTLDQSSTGHDTDGHRRSALIVKA